MLSAVFETFFFFPKKKSNVFWDVPVLWFGLVSVVNSVLTLSVFLRSQVSHQRVLKEKLEEVLSVKFG